MPALIALLVNLLRVMIFVNIGKWIIGLFGFLGLQFVAYEYGVEPFLDQIRDMMSAGPGGTFGQAALNWIGVMQFDRAVTMLISAWMVAQGIKAAKLTLGRVVS